MDGVVIGIVAAMIIIVGYKSYEWAAAKIRKLLKGIKHGANKGDTQEKRL